MRDNDSVLFAIGEIYRAGEFSDCWPEALSAIASCFEDRGAILVYQHKSSNIKTLVSKSLESVQKHYIEAGWWKKELRFDRAAERGYFTKPQAITDRHIVSDDEIENHPYYTDFLKPNGLKWFAGFSITPDEEMFAALSIQRSLSKEPFSEEELQVVELLGVHVGNALRVSLKLSRSQSTVELLSDLLDRMSIGVLALSPSGQTHLANNAARRLLAGSFDQHLTSDDPLTFASGKQLRQPIQTALATSQALGIPRLLHTFHTDEGMTVAYLLPTEQDDMGLNKRGMHPETGAVIVLLSSGQPNAPDPLVVRDLLGLTLSEARIAALIGAGLTPRGVSSRLDITEQSARTVLKRVFQKTGISRQADLMHLLSRVTLP